MNAQAESRLPLQGLLVIQILIGYEWLMSGLTKMVRGGFPSGLTAELQDKSQGAAVWYKDFLDTVVIPNGSVVGYLIEIGELVVGLALVTAAVLWMLRWQRLGIGARSAVLLGTAAAASGGFLMNINFHLANGSPHPWLIPSSGFDEGVDLDSLMPAIQVVLIAVSVGVWLAMRQRGEVGSWLPQRHQARMPVDQV